MISRKIHVFCDLFNQLFVYNFRLKKQIERKEKQAEAAVKRDEKRAKSFKPPMEKVSQIETKKTDLDINALKAKMDKQKKKKSK